MFRMNRHRSEDGFSTLSTLIGSVLGAMIIGGFMLFWFTADDGAQTSAERSRQETAANTVLNRAGRDISESRVVVKSAPRDFIVEKVTAAPTATNPGAQTVTRTRYAVETREGKQVLVRQVKTLTPTSSAPVVPAYNPSTPWAFDSEQVLGRNVDQTKTKFDYRSATGATTSSPNDVGRVDITYVANTKGGQVELKSSASINEAIGGDGQRGGDDGSLDADEDQVTIVAGQTGTLNIGDNDAWTGTATFAIVPGHNFNGTISPVAPDGAMTLTPSAAITTPTVYTLTYRLTDGSGQSVTATIRVSVQVPLSQPAIQWDDICTTDGSDSYTLPTRTGIIYLVSRNGGAYAVTPAGTHNVTGEGTRISVALRAVTDNPAPGYVIREGSNFVLDVAETDAYTFDEMTCSVQPFVLNGVDGQSDTSGTNRIAFSGGFLHYQRVSGPPVAGQPDSGVVPAATDLIRGTVDHPVSLGSRYTYTLVKTRNRVADTQAGRTNGLRTAVQNDQFPLVPAVTATGGNTGTNTVSGLGTGGIVDRVDLRILQSYLSGGNVLLRDRSTIQNVPATYADSGASRGTEATYFGIARSQCRTAPGAALTDCFSWGGGSTASSLIGQPNVYGGTGIARAYQSPATRPAGVTGGTVTAKDCFAADGTRTVNPAIAANGSNQAYHCASGASGISWSASNADHNMPADSKFCSYPGNPGNCYVQGQRPGGTYQSATSPMSVYQSGWGVRDDYSVRSCNAAGCAEGGQDMPMFSFAGPTEVNKVNQPEEKRFLALQAWYGGGCWDNGGCQFASASEARAAWSDSTGAVNYRFTTGQPGSAPEIDDSAGANSYYGFYSVVPTRTYYVRAIAHPANGDFWRRTATAAKGDAMFFASPPHVSYLQDSPFCRPGDDDAWNYGFMYKKQAINPSGGDVTDYVPLQARHMWWLSKMAASSGDNIGVTAAPYWRRTDANNAFAAPGDWTTSTVYWGFSGNQDMDGGWTKQRVDGRIPPLGGGGYGGVAHLRIEVFVTKAGAGNPDFGDLRYWNGNQPDGETSDQIAGADLRVRAENVTKAEVENCAGNGTAGNAFETGSNWSAMSDGAKVTRRYSLVGNVSSRQPPSALRWNGVS